MHICIYTYMVYILVYMYKVSMDFVAGLVIDPVSGVI